MRINSRLFAGAGSAALLALSLVACGSTSSDEDSDGESIQIGVVLDLTGVFASASEPVMNGIQLAVDEVNESGGINGRQVELLVEDATSDPAVAAAAARTLSDQVEAVIGTISGTGCRAMQPILAAANVLHYCASPQPFDLTPQFFWGLAPTSDYPTATAPWLQNKGIHRIAFIGQDDAAGDGYLQVFTRIAQESPEEFEVVAEERFGSGATNLETQMTHLRDADPDLVVAGTSGSNIVPVVRAMNALGMSQPLYLGTGSATLDALAPVSKDIPAGGIFTNAFWVDVSGEVPDSVAYADQVREFAAAYSEQYGEPNAPAGGAYDSTMQIIGAFEGGAAIGEEIATYLEENDYTGVLGPYDLSEERHQGASVPPIMMSYTGDESFSLAFSPQD